MLNSEDHSNYTKIEKINFHPAFFSTWEINTFDSDIIFREDTPIISIIFNNLTYFLKRVNGRILI